MTNNEVDKKVKVVGREEIAENVVLLTLADPTGADLPEWEAGAHIDIVIDVDTARQYSLCSSPKNRKQYQIAVLREENGRGGSKHIFDNIKDGQEIVIRGPRNHFPLATSHTYLFIAGGIGVTPMLPMIEEAEAAGASWQLYYGGHTRKAMSFVDELSKYGDKVTLVVRDETDKSLRYRLTELLETPHGGTQIYCCGPEGLIEACENGTSHWAKGALHVERFSPQEYDGENIAFEVELVRSKLNLHVPAERSIVEVVQDAGIMVLTSCKDGVCGTCETIVLEGEIDHRDSVFNAEEKETADSMMICVSRCKGPKLVLDL